jgi:hypothetical protein
VSARRAKSTHGSKGVVGGYGGSVPFRARRHLPTSRARRGVAGSEELNEGNVGGTCGKYRNSPARLPGQQMT